MRKVVENFRHDSEALQELLELSDELCVHRLHQGPEALVPHQGLLCFQLLVDKLLQGNAVHRILQGQLSWGKKENESVTVRMLPQEVSQSQLFYWREHQTQRY